MNQQCLGLKSGVFLMPLRAISSGPLRVIAMLTTAVFLQGCFVSDVPAITTKTAEDVGPQLQYWMYDAYQVEGESKRSKSELVRFVQQSGVDYQTQIGPDDTSATDPFQNGVYLRRLGMRDKTPVFLVQFDLARGDLPGREGNRLTPDELGFGFMFYPLAIDIEEFGTVGVVSCDDRVVLTVAEKYGINLSCMEFDSTMLPRITNRPSEAQIWSFFQYIVQNGLLQWEDTTGVGVLDWIE